MKARPENDPPDSEKEKPDAEGAYYPVKKIDTDMWFRIDELMRRNPVSDLFPEPAPGLNPPVKRLEVFVLNRLGKKRYRHPAYG